MKIVAINGSPRKNGNTALVLEAHRRGVSYGQLVANTSQRELDEIIRAYCGGKARKKKRRRLYADDT